MAFVRVAMNDPAAFTRMVPPRCDELGVVVVRRRRDVPRESESH